MEDAIMRAVAIVGVGAILPDAPDVKTFWTNISAGRSSVSEVPPGRWNPALYYDADRSAPDKTYSKIGGWVQQADWNPVAWRLPIPPRVANAMDEAQRWGIACSVQALADYGYPSRPLNPERTAVILGNAMAGEKHYVTAMRVSFPEYARLLEGTSSFSSLPAAVREAITREWHERLARSLPEITEDCMPGELANCIAGRIANLMNFRGPNFVVDAACASAMAAIHAAAEGLSNHEFDAAVTGGIDRNMSAHTFVKFCKIGALSATGSRPYADGADGFVMGEGAVLFLLKRLADAEAAGDRIYAVIRGVGASSDGKGKGITAPNPVGQRLAIERAWRNAGLPPESVTMVEGHGTSTAVGDVVEVESLVDVFGPVAPRKGAVALGSVKSNIGHLKGAAGAAGLLKTALALHNKQIPPSANFERPNPNIAFNDSPFTVPTEARPWEVPEGATRRAGVSAFGFGGTNFHVVLEEFVPGRLTAKGKSQVGASAESPVAAGKAETGPRRVGPLGEPALPRDGAPEAGPPRPGGRTATATAAPGPEAGPPSIGPLGDRALPQDGSERPELAEGHRGGQTATAPAPPAPLGERSLPLRGCLVVGAQSSSELIDRLREIESDARKGGAAMRALPASSDLAAPERVAIDYGEATELADKCARAVKALGTDAAPMWKALRAQGIFRGRGPKPKVAFLYTGQGSQYVNMLRGLRDRHPVVRATFDEADRITTPLLGKPVTQFLFADSGNAEALAAAEESLRQTAVTQPAVLTVDTALTRLLATFGVVPDMVMGHSLGEYGALHAAGALPLADALEAVSARGREMTKVSVADNGRMAAVFAPMAEIERLLRQVDGYVVVANINSASQAVVGGATGPVTRAIEVFRAAGFQVMPLSVSHAFHTSIVAPASAPLRMVLERLNLTPPTIPVVANVTGDFYPMGPDARPAMLDLLGRQVASPVQFVKGLETLFAAGARVFVEVGPKKALHGFAEEAFGHRPDVSCLFANHPKLDDVVAFNQALCGLYAAGLGTPAAADTRITPSPLPEGLLMNEVRVTATVFHDKHTTDATERRYTEIGRRLAPVIEQCLELFGEARPAPIEPVVVSGAAMGLPGSARVFDDGNIGRLLRGERLIGAIPDGVRQAMAEKRITRLVKSEVGEPRFDVIEDPADVIKLAARAGAFDMGKEFGIPEDRLAALDNVTRLAIGAGLDALRDAGIPLVLRYKTTTRGTQLPDRWGLPESLRDETGIIFGSAFPGLDSLVGEVTRYHVDRGRREKLDMLQSLRSMMNGNVDDSVRAAIDARMRELQEGIDRDPYLFDRRFLLRTLAMGHSQFAELIGARGPNTQVNAACATTTHAVSLAEDWIRQGRCRRVIVITADDVTTDNLLEWFGAGFLASGAAATDERVEDAVLPFDRRRHGLVVGMGAAAVVVESAAALRERGVQPICQLMASVSANSAFHGTRLDVQHIAGVMEQVVSDAERRWQLDRREMAGRLVFVSHETYTPARGGSASAEATALRRVFGEHAGRIVIANTKGYTGHPMAAGIEDVAAIKILETGIVPAVANHRELDPELGPLNLSRGGEYPVEFALRLGAGFGSQIAMSLMRWVPTANGQRRSPDTLGYDYRVADAEAWREWLKRISTGESTDLEVVSRTLRVKASPVSKAAPAPAANATPPVDWEGTLAGVAPHHRPVVEPTPAQSSAGTEAEPTPAQPAPSADTEPRPTAPRPTPSAGMEPGPAAAPVGHGSNPEQQIMEEKRVVGQGFGPAQRPTEDDIKKAVLAVVVEKTGYPEEMLDLDLDLEADLGVDTVKQAELMASIRGEYGIPRDDKLKLRDFPTLAHVIRFVHDRLPQQAAEKTSVGQGFSPAPQVTEEKVPVGHGSNPEQQIVEEKRVVGQGFSPAQQPTEDDIKKTVLALVVEKTGYPEEMLDLDLDLEADLGVDTVKQAELMASIRGKYGIPRDDKLKLRDFPTLAHVIRFVHDRLPQQAAEKTSVGQGFSPAQQVTEEKAPVGHGSNPEQQIVEETRVVGQGFSPARQPSEDDIKKTVLALVVEKTGYPEEMLDLELDLEADLGVDTVKQAELMASIRGKYGIPRDDKLKLRDFPTLAHVIRFVHDRLPKPEPQPDPPAPPPSSSPEPARQDAQSPAHTADLKVRPVEPSPATTEARPAASQPVPPAHTEAAPAASQPGQGSRRVTPPAPPRWVTPRTFQEASLVSRRVPTPVLRPPLAMCKPTGVGLQAGKRVVVMCDESGAGSLLITHLRDLGVQCLLIGGAPSAVELGARIHGWLAGGPIHGVFWLPALDPEGEWRHLTPDMWHEATYRRIKLLGVTMRALYEQVSRPGTFLVAGTRMGGHHGYDPTGAASPLGGAVSGFLKAYKRERPDALVKVVDFGEDTPLETVASRLLDETQRDPACVEVGYRLGERWTITLVDSDGPGAVRPTPLDNRSVFVVTGAAGSVVSAIVGDLAAASGGTFYLLDRVERPDPANPDLARLVADREGLKRELMQRARTAGERVTPAMIERELAGIERQQAALAAIQSVESVGGRAIYLQVDLTDARAVASAIDTVRAGSGHIDVLLHGAGIEISRSLCNKAQPEFDLVFDVKATGFFNLLHAIGDMPLGASVAFSSVAGRFGNAGQTDYSAANDLLCKAASSFRRSRPGTRGIAIDWTAWRDIGMASRGSIPMLLEQAGIEMLPPDAGIPIIRQHLVEGWTSGEVVVAGRLGMMMAEADVTGGLDMEALRKLHATRPYGPMIGRIVSMSVHGGLEVETGLDPAVQPFLSDHRIDGVAVLPGAMGVEAFGELASLVLPEWKVASVEDVRFHAPFKFYKGAPRTVVLRAMFRAEGDSIVADCRLIGYRTLPGQPADRETTHFTGVVRLQRHVGQPERVRVPRTDAARRVEAPDIYRIYFHGPAYRVLDHACRVHRAAIGRMTNGLPANHVPTNVPTVMGPRLIELAFQAAGIWDLGVNGHLSLPHAVDRVARYGGTEPDNASLVAIVHPDPRGNLFDADVVDDAGRVYLSIRGYRIVELPGAPDAELLRPLREAMEAEAVAPARLQEAVAAEAPAPVVAVGAQQTGHAAVLVPAH